MADQGEDRTKARRPVLAAVLAAPVGVALLVLCVSFFRAARGVFSDQQAPQRVIVVVVTLLGAALALGLLGLAAANFVRRREVRVAPQDPEPPAAS